MRVVSEDFQGALRTHAAPHGNLEREDSEESIGTTFYKSLEEPEGLLDRSITFASLTFNTKHNLAFFLCMYFRL